MNAAPWSDVIDLQVLPDRKWFKAHPNRTTYVRRIRPADKAPPDSGCTSLAIREITPGVRSRQGILPELLRLAHNMWNTKAGDPGEAFCCFVWSLIIENEANGGFVDLLTLQALKEKYAPADGGV